MKKYVARMNYSTKTVFVDKKLKYQPYAQAGVRKYENGTIQLISYVTTVCETSSDGWLSCTGTYSQTTRTHIGSFLKEYAPTFNYYTAKRIYENDERINIYTGEIEKL